MQTSYWYSSYSGLSISTPVVTSQFLSSQIKVIYVFSLSYPHSYQFILLLSETPGNNSVLLKYATTHATADRGTAHELRPRLFPHFVVNPLLLRSNPAPFQVTPLSLCTSLTYYAQQTGYKRTANEYSLLMQQNWYKNSMLNTPRSQVPYHHYLHKAPWNQK